MQVIIQRNFFGADGNRYRMGIRRGDPIFVPEVLRGKLPKDAEIVSDNYVNEEPEEVEPVVNTLGEAAASIVPSQVVQAAALQSDADAGVNPKAEAFQVQLAQEQAADPPVDNRSPQQKRKDTIARKAAAAAVA